MSAFIPIGYRGDSALTSPRDVCPHCKRPVVVYVIHCENQPVGCYRCPEHGDVVPMRSCSVSK